MSRYVWQLLRQEMQNRPMLIARASQLVKFEYAQIEQFVDLDAATISRGYTVKKLNTLASILKFEYRHCMHNRQIPAIPARKAELVIFIMGWFGACEKNVVIHSRSRLDLLRRPATWTVVDNTTWNVLATSEFSDQNFLRLQDPKFVAVTQLGHIRVATPSGRFYSFLLTEDHMHLLRGPAKNYVHMRIYDHTRSADRALVAPLKVNDHAVLIPSELPDVAQRRDALVPRIRTPIDITAHVIPGTNMIDAPGICPDVTVVVQITEQVTSDRLLESLQARPPPPTAVKSFKEDDGEVYMSKYRVSLKCPLALCHIRLPAKGVRCTHPQCFDAQSYIEFCAQTRKWTCPVCEKVFVFFIIWLASHVHSALLVL